MTSSPSLLSRLAERFPAAELSAHFERFTVTVPAAAAVDCSASGANDEAVAHWVSRVPSLAEIPADKLAAELKEFGAWDSEELADDAANRRRILWAAAHNLRELEDAELAAELHSLPSGLARMVNDPQPGDTFERPGKYAFTVAGVEESGIRYGADGFVARGEWPARALRSLLREDVTATPAPFARAETV